MSEERSPHECDDRNECCFVASATDMCEIWQFKRLLNYAHTPGIRFSNMHFEPNSSVTIFLTRCENVGPSPTAPGLLKVEFMCWGEIMIPLTKKRPELVSNRQVPVLYYPFRKEEPYCRDGHTARKIAKTAASSMNAVQQVTFSAYPMIFPRAKHIRSFTGGDKPSER